MHKNDEPGVSIPPETRVKQGYLELSNVNIVEEMVKMIQSLRAFESYQRSIKVLDSIDNKSINEVGKLR
jgi:flagellar basal-body rod protein FlgG